MPNGSLKKLTVSLPPELEGRVILMPEFTVVPVFKGDGKRHYQCSECGVTLIEGLHDNSHITNIIVRCPKCKTYNEVNV